MTRTHVAVFHRKLSLAVNSLDVSECGLPRHTANRAGAETARKSKADQHETNQNHSPKSIAKLTGATPQGQTSSDRWAGMKAITRQIQRTCYTQPGS